MFQVLFADPILIAAAVIPALVLFIFVYKKDRLEKEPLKLLVTLAIWGVVSTMLASMTETLGIAFLPYVFSAGSKAYNIALYFIVVGLSEEGFKYLLLKWKTWKSAEFNCQFDGIVYAVFVSLGFALWENITYVIAYGFETAVARALTAIPGHACFGVFMGTYYGTAKRCEIAGDTEKCKLMKKLSLFVPVFLHGLYDYLATSIEDSGSLLFLAFIAVFFFFAFKTVNKYSKEDRYIVSQTQGPDDGSF